ncbi:hypothetical protein C0991_009526 [Blastosporella zonata]|nr:hypothetical protein C0991_009526 [Blastosporella zonata]
MAPHPRTTQPHPQHDNDPRPHPLPARTTHPHPPTSNLHNNNSSSMRTPHPSSSKPHSSGRGRGGVMPLLQRHHRHPSMLHRCLSINISSSSMEVVLGSIIRLISSIRNTLSSIPILSTNNSNSNNSNSNITSRPYHTINSSKSLPHLNTNPRLPSPFHNTSPHPNPNQSNTTTVPPPTPTPTPRTHTHTRCPLHH